MDQVLSKVVDIFDSLSGMWNTTQQHSLTLDINLQQHHLVDIWLSLEVN
jgi:hypothetical protein